MDRPTPSEIEPTTIDINSIFGPIVETTGSKTNTAKSANPGSPASSETDIDNHKKMVTKKENPLDDLEDDHLSPEDSARLRRILAKYTRFHDGTMI